MAAGFASSTVAFAQAGSDAVGQGDGPDGPDEPEGTRLNEGRPRLTNEEMNAMAGVGPDGTFGPNDRFGRTIHAALEREPVANHGKRADHANVKYGEHERNTFDLWMAGTDEASPLVVFIHGGGFRRGDKALLYDSSVLTHLLDAGVSVAGINYRYAHQSPDGSLGSLRDVARFIQFIRHHAEQYHIKKDKIACYGGSAGGVASLWLALSDDLADPDNADLILRESTRLTCAGAMATPATSDVLQWVEILGITREQAIGFARTVGGIADEAELFTEEGIRNRRALDHLSLMSADDPPLFIQNGETGETPSHYGHMAHHPNHARVLKERADAVGIEVVANAPEIGLVDPSGEDLVGFLLRHLQGR